MVDAVVPVLFYPIILVNIGLDFFLSVDSRNVVDYLNIELF